MTSSLTLAARMTLDNQRWQQGLNQSRTATRGFVAGVKREFSDLRSFLSSTTGRLASLGAGFSAANELMRSARMDKTLTQIGQTAGASKIQIASLRGELFGMAGDTGRAVEDIQEGFNILIQSGLTWAESKATIVDVNKAMAVTGAQATTLAGTLGVAATAFNFDLSRPREALGIMDKMTVAGRLGKAELENLGSIFSRVGPNAKGAGFGFEQTLAFIEGLSNIESQPERLATLADSTLRLFTNAKYMRDAQKATGIKFFDQQGARRDPLSVLADMKKIMDGMKTDAQREGFLSKAFGNADLDTIKGLRTILQGNSLSQIGDFTRQIQGATGSLERDLPDAIRNAVDQSGRLKAKLIEAADSFAKPINSVFSRLTHYALASKKDGGLEMSGGEIALTGAVSLAALYAGGKFGKGMLGRLSGGAAGLGTGVAMGQALDKAGAATPVFIVGAAPGLFGLGAGGVGGMPPVVPAGKTPTTVAGLARRRLGGLGRAGLGLLGSASLPLSMLADPRNQDIGNSPAFQNYMAENKGQGFAWIRELLSAGGTKGGIGPGTGLPGKLDLNVHVTDSRVTVTPSSSSGNVGRVRTTNARGTRPRTGRMMDAGGGR